MLTNALRQYIRNNVVSTTLGNANRTEYYTVLYEITPHIDVFSTRSLTEPLFCELSRQPSIVSLWDFDTDKITSEDERTVCGEREGKQGVQER